MQADRNNKSLDTSKNQQKKNVCMQFYGPLIFRVWLADYLLHWGNYVFPYFKYPMTTYSAKKTKALQLNQAKLTMNLSFQTKSLYPVWQSDWKHVNDEIEVRFSLSKIWLS